MLLDAPAVDVSTSALIILAVAAEFVVARRLRFLGDAPPIIWSRSGTTSSMSGVTAAAARVAAFARLLYDCRADRVVLLADAADCVSAAPVATAPPPPPV